jgi:transposase
VEKPAGLPITDADWQRTPTSVQMLVISLLDLQQRVVQLEKQWAGRRPGGGSTGSAPPTANETTSATPSTKKRSKHRPSGRSSGAQPGHEGHGRTLLSVERVDAMVPIKPSCCGHCGHALAGKDPHPQRHQVIDIPPVRTRVTEYQLHTLRYPQCQMLSEAEWPERVPRSAFGPTVQAWVGLLSGAYRLSKRNIVTLLSGVFDIDLGLGSVSQLEQHVSAAIAAPVAQARDYVRRQAAVHIAKPVGAKPATRPGCGRWPATRLRCSTFAGTAIPRWPVTCWALTPLLWSARTATRPTATCRCGSGRGAGRTCTNLRQIEPALWTFVRKEGVEPTNNAAERALRHGVLWRHTSFGTHSPAGSRFVERMLTVRDTLRQQQRNVLDYLTLACQSALRHQSAPSLLPTRQS